jgi:undecaprenyl-diphosphatase
MTGIALLGGGLLAATAASTVAQAAVPFGAAALGAGLVSAVGFPYFTRYVPDGQAGRYAGAFFSARAIASTAALPTAGLLIAATGSYRALLGMGALGLAGLAPLARAERHREGAVAAALPPIRRLTAVIPVYRSDRAAAATLRDVVRDWAPRIGLGMLLAWTVAAALPLLAAGDERLFLAINGLGDGPEWLYQALDPHSRNYLLLAAAATLTILARTRRLRFAGGALLAMAFAGVFADLVLEVVQLAVDRPRPEEALGAEALRSHGRHWSHIPSFPSGHLIVTTALVTAAATMARLLRVPAFTYLAAIAVTRITFGAHFPLDVVVGTIIGWQIGLFSVALIRAARLLPQPGRIAADRRTTTATSAPFVMPNAAPASTSSQK